MKHLILSFIFIGLGSELFAQGEANSLKGVSPRERIVSGGGFGLGFGSRQDYVMVAPVIGYAITKKFLAGTGVTYRYTKYKNVLPNTNVSTNDFGLNPFLRFTVYQGFFVQTEYEYLNYEGIRYPPLETVRSNFDSFMAGGGILQPMGEKASFYLMALYNFSYRTPQPGQYFPYNSPWVIRAGINIGGFIF